MSVELPNLRARTGNNPTVTIWNNAKGNNLPDYLKGRTLQKSVISKFTFLRYYGRPM